MEQPPRSYFYGARLEVEGAGSTVQSTTSPFPSIFKHCETQCSDDTEKSSIHFIISNTTKRVVAHLKQTLRHGYGALWCRNVL